MPGVGPNGTLGLEGDTQAVYFPPDPYDPGRAKKLLAEAGYPKGFHGGTFYPYDGPYWPYSEQVANYWKAIGITLDSVLLDRPAWLSKRTGGQMKGAIFIDGAINQPTVGGALEFLLNSGYAYGAYPEIQSLWEQYNKTVDVKGRTDLIARIQKLIYDKTMVIPLTTSNSPAAFGPRVKGNPYQVQPLLWFVSPMEDMELNE